jgi:hypothetical protein
MAKKQTSKTRVSAVEREPKGFWTPKGPYDEPPWELEKADREWAKHLGMELEEYRKLEELARMVPGPDTPHPRDKIRRYLIAEYGFSPQILWGLTPKMMRMYIEARRDKGGGEAEDTRAIPNNPRTPRQQAVQRDAKAEARDKWLYRQASKKNPPPWKVLKARLSRIADRRSWRKLESEQAVQQAVNRYVKRNGLDPLRPRRGPEVQQ